MFDVIIPAAGESARFSGKLNKLLCTVSGRTVVENAVIPFLNTKGVEKIIIATSASLKDEITSLFSPFENVIVCNGGATRTQTVRLALQYATAEYVLIHDGARPFIRPDVINRVISSLSSHEAVVPVIPFTDSVADVSCGYKAADRNNYVSVQTPQGFRTALLKEAYSLQNGDFTDDVSLFLTRFDDVARVDGDVLNKKITYPSDLLSPATLTGVGYDTHRFAKNRRFVLGGVEIPFDKGLLGHSDADVLTHAVMDALLTAVGEKDIGCRFPDSAEKYKDADSMSLLSEVMTLVNKKGFAPYSLAATVVCENPRLNPYREQITNSLADALSVAPDRIGLAFTTSEGIGETGKGLAVNAIAAVSLISKQTV
ncbi:MAG: 2-C-methyl-D-erythritol 2,4-cyclodiphosphate synthase [Christensenellaceae bacterium]|nr:2-C-methyl-D-erythritol 2,4-cyclodiphosphate synthase [Christensenellaceae bacterium]